MTHPSLWSQLEPFPLSSPEISPWTGRFYSLLDPSYAKNNIPIIASVSEHQPTTWSSFYFDLQLLVFMFPGERMCAVKKAVLSMCVSAVGLWFCFSKLTDQNIFIILYGLTSVYFAVSVCLVTGVGCVTGVCCVQGVMVRLMLVLAPVMCILSGIAVSGLLNSFMKNLDVMNLRKKKRGDSTYPLKNEVAGGVILVLTLFLVSYTFHCTWVSLPPSPHQHS